MTDDRLFAIEDVPVVPLLREPRARKGAAVGSALDARFKNDYPPEWHCCPRCDGTGYACPDCLGMGSVKARVRLEAGHRCVRCKHPYMPKGDAAMLGVEPSWQPDGWSRCDDDCRHGGPVRYWTPTTGWGEYLGSDETIAEHVEAQWRILTVHHLDGDKANLRWWNLLAACQRCHLEIQGKVVMERVYPHPHSEWFRPFVAGYYAWVYLGEDLTRAEVDARMDELLALELDPAYGDG